MPLNAPVEFFLAEKKYFEATTDAERLVALEEMLRTCPKHKGAENKLKEIKQRIAKLKEKLERAKRKSRRSREFVRKQGIQIAIVGPPNSGKTKLFNALTESHERATEIPFETKAIIPRMILLKDVRFQILDTPSITEKNKDKIIGLAKCSDLTLALGNVNIPKSIKLNGSESISEITEKIFTELNIIRIFTKPPGGETAKEAIALPRGSTVHELTKRVGKEFARNFKFARVWGSTKFPGQQVGLDYVLSDGDVIEIHTN